MKKYVIILFALLISAVVFAENAETDVSMAKITLNTGDVFIGEIIVENEHILMIRTAEGTRFQFPVNDIELIEKNYAVSRIAVVEQRVALPREIPPPADENPVIFEQRNDLAISSLETETENVFRRNELRVNMLSPLIDNSFEFSYERILNTSLSIGFDCGLMLGHSQLIAIAFLPYFRGFLGNRQQAATGFFGETHALISIFTVQRPPPPLFGFGTGIGYKHVSNNNWVVEIVCALSRIINHDTLYLSIRFSIGRRF